MAFACIHIPNFILQAALRTEPLLHTQPVGILDGSPPFVTVIAKNKKAESLGLQIEMTKSQAEQIEGLQLRRRVAGHEAAAHAALMDLALSFSPRIEETAADTVILDLAGLDKLSGGFEKLARRLSRRAKKFGLSAQVAVGSNPEAAQLAARGFAGVTVLAPEEEMERLGSLPIAALNPPLEMQETLERWGVRTCRMLASLPVEQLSERLGQEGVRLQELARGASERALIPTLAASQFEEMMELDSPVGELEPLSFLLGRLLDQLCARLSARALATNEIHLKMQLEPGEEEIFGITSKSHLPAKHGGMSETNPLSTPSSNEIAAPLNYEHTLRLPLPMRDSKALLRLWRMHLESHPPASPIVKIQMVAEPAKIRFAQSGLFIPLSPDPEKLEITMARTAHFAGSENIGSPEPLDTHRPLSFRMDRFNPMETEDSVSSTDPALRLPATALRVFRPAMPVRVEARDHTPARIYFGGVWGDVMAASGPWRSSGDWWTENQWNQDEWDLEIEFPVPAANEVNAFAHTAKSARKKSRARGVYRITRERASGEWFVRGVYD
jgi:protein ImuB